MAQIAEKPPHFIRQWRQHRGLTLEQLAERANSTHATLSRIERFLLPYSQSLLERLADILNTQPASLIMRDPTDENGIWDLWDGLDATEKRQALGVLRAIKSPEAPNVVALRPKRPKG